MQYYTILAALALTAGVTAPPPSPIPDGGVCTNPPSAPCKSGSSCLFVSGITGLPPTTSLCQAVQTTLGGPCGSVTHVTDAFTVCRVTGTPTGVPKPKCVVAATGAPITQTGHEGVCGYPAEATGGLCDPFAAQPCLGSPSDKCVAVFGQSKPTCHPTATYDFSCSTDPITKDTNTVCVDSAGHKDVYCVTEGSNPVGKCLSPGDLSAKCLRPTIDDDIVTGDFEATDFKHCNKGLKCHEDKCYKLGKVGDLCGDHTDRICDRGLKCELELTTLTCVPSHHH